MDSNERKIIGQYQRINDQLPPEADPQKVWEHDKFFDFDRDLPWLRVKAGPDWKMRYQGAAADMFEAAKSQINAETRLRFLDKVAPTPIQTWASPFFTIWDALKDLFYSRRIKTRLMTLGMLALGAAVGVGIAVGISLLATTIGGPVGGVIASAVFTYGGMVGLAFMGAKVGEFLGKKLTQKVFSDERKFEPSKKHSENYKKTFRVSEDVYLMMNAYLRNREQTVQNAYIKRYLSFLRKGALKACDADMHFRLGHYFMNELKELKKIEKQQGKDEALSLNIQAVTEILEALKNGANDKNTKEKISEILERYEVSSAKAARINPKLKKDFQRVKQNVRAQSTPQENEYLTEHRVLRHSNPRAIVKKVTSESFTKNNRVDDQYKIKVSEFSKLSAKQKQDVINRLFDQVGPSSTGDAPIIVGAQGNREFAFMICREAMLRGELIEISPVGFGSEKAVREIEKSAKQSVKRELLEKGKSRSERKSERIDSSVKKRKQN